MKRLAWFIVFFIIVVAIKSKNSSIKHQGIIQYTPIRAPSIGYCDCPYDYDLRGYLCGERSAYIQSGGNEPVCYARISKFR